jgi:superfamily II DNA or RNA helicase
MFTSSKKGEPKYNPDAQIIITNRQYLFSNIDRLPKIDAIINDEVHQSKPDSQTLNVVDNMFDCKIKVGLSGTLPRHKYSKLSLVGSFGRIVYVETITDLQEQGYITKLKINVLSIKDKDIEKDRNCLFHEHSFVKFALDGSSGIDFNAAYDAEIDYINKNYVKLYSPILDILNNLEGNTLVLFDRIEFGQNMFSMTKESMFNKSVHYIDGQTPIIERENGRSMMETSNNNIMFGQCSILSTGINIKNLTNLVLMVSTKSFSRILQSIGRTLRLHQDKDYAQLYDISFNFKYSQKHFKERINIYKEMYHKKPDSIKVFEV